MISHAGRRNRWSRLRSAVRPCLSACGVAVLFLAPTARGAEQTPFDFERLAAAVVRVEAKVPQDARTADTLGRERAGNGVVIDDGGLVLTIGYLILEASEVTLITVDGKAVPAAIVAYDHESGFGLLRALSPLRVAPVRLGDSAGIAERDPILIVASGGRTQTIGAFVVGLREFAGYWEYLLERAIFTTPPHPNWGGAALIDRQGRLVGIGSLMVPDALRGDRPLPGNMFVPVELLRPIMADLLAGARPGPRRPWLGVISNESSEGIVVMRVAPGSPAEQAGIRRGDVILAVGGSRTHNVSEMYRKLWSLGEAGVQVPLQVRRGDASREITVRSGDRYRYLKLESAY